MINVKFFSLKSDIYSEIYKLKYGWILGVCTRWRFARSKI